MPKVELKSQLRKMPRYFDGILRKLVGEGVLVEEGTTVSLPSHSVRLSQGQQAKVDAFLKVITQNPYYPPADLSLDTELLNMLLQEGKVIKVGDGVIFSNFAYEEMVKQIIEHIKNHGRITVAEVRDVFQTSRKYAVALMEYLDDQKITRRIGNERLLR
jgi:selenocysteine-specific elongation factor